MSASRTLKSVLKTLPLLALLCPVVCAARPTASDTGAARTVKYSQQDIIQVRAKVRFSTLIVLPQSEEILDFATGDKDFWIINGAHNLCFVHPAQAGIRSDLHLITASGHVYSFLLSETSKDTDAEPDLKIFVEPNDESHIGAVSGQPGYVRATEAEAYKKELDALRAETEEQTRNAKAQVTEQITKFRSEYSAKVRFDYTLPKKAAQSPFLVTAIYHDDAFTYIQCAAREKPALYEIKDGKPNLTNFQVENGVYIVTKVVDNGYLAIGKKKLAFARHE